MSSDSFLRINRSNHVNQVSVGIVTIGRLGKKLMIITFYSYSPVFLISLEEINLDVRAILNFYWFYISVFAFFLLFS